MSTATRRKQRLLDSVERVGLAARASGLSRARVEDVHLDGRLVTLDGEQLVNFGSCAYLGLNTDPRLKAGAIEAVQRYGPVFSSSVAYTSVPLYTDLETRMARIVDSNVLITPTVTLTHIGVLPVLIGADDAVVIDSQTHASVHLATQVLAAEGVPIHVEPHGAFERLEAAIAERSVTSRSVWLLADGIYSMLGDVLPMDWIHRLLGSYENLRVYIDDAHGFSWQGRHGRGHALREHPIHPRMVLAVSLTKSFGSGGAMVVLPDLEEVRRVQMCAGTLIFSGPVHPAELGAAVAAADIHLSDEHAGMQAALVGQIELIRRLADDHDVPLVNRDESPIWFVRAGGLRSALDLGRRMIKDGFFLNFAGYPAVANAHSGLRFTHTRYHSAEDLEAMMRALGDNLRIVTEAGTDLDLTKID